MTDVTPPMSLEGLRILVVEDSPDIQLMLTRFLRAEGAKVDVADDGMSALDRASESDYDVVLMDLNLPKLDGYTTIAAMRERGHTFPVIALTGHTMTEVRERCLSSGFNYWLSKPVDRQTLINEVAQIAKIGIH